MMKKARVILMVLVVAVLAASTFIERFAPEVHPYSSWWFIALMAIVGVGAVVSIVQGRMWKRPPLLMIHASVVLILAGGALTSWTAKDGIMQLAPGEQSNAYVHNYEAIYAMPFAVELIDFDIVYYDGTRTPMDYVSRVRALGKEYTISMNHILRLHGYRFYQMGYGPDGSTQLRVSHDPWGIPVAYTGFALLIIGLLLLLFHSNGRYRQLWRGTAIALLLFLPTASFAATPRTLPRPIADQVGQLHVLYQGRICPVETLAKDFTTKLTGKATYRGLTAEQVLCGYLFYYSDWVDEPAIKVKGARSLGLPSRASAQQLQRLELSDASASRSQRAAAEKASLVQMLLGGHLLKLFPVEGNWYGQNDALPLSVADDEYIFIRRWQSYCAEQVMTDNWDELSRVLSKTRSYQDARATTPPQRDRMEHLYNALTTGRYLPMLLLTLGLLGFAYGLLCHVRQRRMRRWVATGETAIAALATLYLLAVFALRWAVGGHVPMAGGFDTMNLMSIVLGLLTLWLGHRREIVPSAGLLAIGFCQLVAMMSGSNPPITSLMPVLHSPLLTLHVATVMCAYALLFFVALFSLAGLLTGSVAFRRTVQLLLLPSVLLLSLGIAIGAVWAGVSWGSYWTWDPKEVWALITLILYAFPLHQGVLHRTRGFYLYCALAFFSVAITYFGVSLLFGGMHAYN